ITVAEPVAKNASVCPDIGPAGICSCTSVSKGVGFATRQKSCFTLPFEPPETRLPRLNWEASLRRHPAELKTGRYPAEKKDCFCAAGKTYRKHPGNMH